MSSSGFTSDSSTEAKSKGKTEICNSCGNYRLPTDIVPNNTNNVKEMRLEYVQM